MTFCGYHGSTGNGPLTETIVPSSDDSTTGWSSSTVNPIWQELGVETTAAYAQAATSATTQTCPITGDDVLSLNMADPSGPVDVGAVQGMRVRYQVRFQWVGVEPTTFSVLWTVRLKQGSTTIASGTAGPFTDPLEELNWQAESSFSLSQSEVDSITDHAQLKLEATATMCDDGANEVEANLAYSVIDYFAR